MIKFSPVLTSFKGLAKGRITSDMEDRVVLEQWNVGLNDPQLASKATVSESGWVYIKPDPNTPEIRLFANKSKTGGRFLYINLNGYEMGNDNGNAQVSQSNVRLLKDVIDKVFELRHNFYYPESLNSVDKVRDFVRQYLPPKS